MGVAETAFALKQIPAGILSLHSCLQLLGVLPNFPLMSRSFRLLRALGELQAETLHSSLWTSVLSPRFSHSIRLLGIKLAGIGERSHKRWGWVKRCGCGKNVLQAEQRGSSELPKTESSMWSSLLLWFPSKLLHFTAWPPLTLLPLDKEFELIRKYVSFSLQEAPWQMSPRQPGTSE